MSCTCVQHKENLQKVHTTAVLVTIYWQVFIKANMQILECLSQSRVLHCMLYSEHH